ncbi:alpha-2-macroglobulin family protein [Chitinimonas sp.]|uniref:alpha-2-macroglobulin family protein n=1 Tax=Chitinimonas sp. TaxID=1934313 RepID=UPI002F92F1D5
MPRHLKPQPLRPMHAHARAKKGGGRWWPALLFAGLALAAHATSLNRFTPQGDVANVRQVSVGFDAPMQALGQPDTAAPVSWSCTGSKLRGNPRWIDQQTWVLDFDDGLPAGVRCEFKPVAGLKDLEGNAVKSAANYRFNTGAPEINAWIDTGERDAYAIDEEQVFLLQSTAQIDAGSIESRAWCGVEGLGEKVKAKQIAPALKAEILKQYGRQAQANQIVALQCSRSLPSGSIVVLHVDAGFKTITGLASKLPLQREFRVRPAFSVTVNCERENADADCVPFTPMQLRFSGQINEEDLGKIYLVGPNGQKWQAKVQPRNEYEEGEPSTVAEFSGPFAPLSTYSLQVPAKLRDADGRPLANRDRLAKVTVKTGDYPPLLKFAADFGIVERNAGGMLPVTLRNLDPVTDSKLATADGSKPGTGAKVRIVRLTTDEDIIAWMGRDPLFENGKSSDEQRDYRERSLLLKEPKARTLLLPKPNGAKPMEVVGIPLGEPGYYVVEGESRFLGDRLIGKKAPMFVQTRVVNTNLSVHLKLAPENQLVWVTALDTGKPVAGARISVRDCTGKQIAFGDTGADGAMAIRRALPPNPNRCASGVYGYYVSARAKVGGVDDMAFVLSHWQRGIENWRFQLPGGYVLPSIMTHAVLDRALFRAGETVHIKHFARRHTTAGFGAVAAEELPDKLVIQFEGDDQQFEQPLSWKNGAAESSWKIPPAAKLGRYWITYAKADKKAAKVYGDDDGYWGGGYMRGGSFKVGEFRLPVLKGEVTAGKPAVAAKELPLDLKLSYLAGGGASGEKVRVRSQRRIAYLNPVDFDDYSFGGAPLEADRIKAGEWYGRNEENAVVFDDQRDVQLDKSGTRRVTVKEVPASSQPASIYSEMEFTDPSGEIHAASATTAWFPSAVVAGVGTDSWLKPGSPVKVRVATLDTLLKPRAAAYSVHVWHRQSFVHRKRLVGGFYSYEQNYEVQDMGEVCKGKTDGKGKASCEFAPPKLAAEQQSGELIIEVTGRDEAGNKSYASTSVWSGMADDGWFDQGDSDRIDLIPEKKAYEPGETAIFQVRSPFREATALVTVEREGVIDRFVTTVSGNQPTISVPIKPNYGPNVYVSALLIRGRVGDVQPTALVDLGKPAYKLGIAGIKVGQSGYTLGVTVSPEKPVYKTREQASVKVKVVKPDGTPAKGGEFVLAAVDEALLELARNDSWQILARMMAERGYEVETATAQAEVIGKRHFGLKALPAGGGGGKQATRELFDTLIKWDANVKLDDQGEAVVKLPLNDSLTTIRIVAVATQGNNLFGTGWARIRTTKDVQLFSGLPPVVRDPDTFRAGFTVRNMGEAKDTITVTPAAGVVVGANRVAINGLTPQSVTLEPGEGRELAWNLTVPAGASGIDWQVGARGLRGSEDAFKTSQKVLPSFRVSVQGSVLEQVNGSYSVPVKLPADAIPGRGGVEVFLKGKLGASSDGVRSYMESYPYICLEQKVSKSIATASRARWADVMSHIETYLDDNGLAAYYPNPTTTYNRTSIPLTAYLLAASHEAGYEIPLETRSRMLAGLAGFVEGRIQENPEVRWSKGNDLVMRKLTALEALSRYGEATPARLATIQLDPAHWPTGALVDWLNILQRTPQVPNRDKRLAEAEQLLRTRMVSSGTLTQFANESGDYWWWMMVSPDATAARAISALMERPSFQRDVPKLVRGVVARQRGGAWNTTPANVWGSLMLDKFARKYEKTTVAGSTAISLAGSSTPAQSLNWDKASTSVANSKDVLDPGQGFRFNWPASGSGTVSITQNGAGKPWATVRTLAARKLAAPVYSGFTVNKKISAVEQKVPGRWSRGDVVRVELSITAPASWTSVVVNDPVPAGATILGSGLGGESALAQGSGGGSTGSWASYIERAFDAYRAYYGYFWKQANMVYTFRLNNAGDFKLPPTRVEAMYAPENFGEAPNGDWHVEQ